MIALAVLLAAVGLAQLAGKWWPIAVAVVVTVGPWSLGAGWHTLWIAALCLLVVVVWVDAGRHDSRAGTALLVLVGGGFLLTSGLMDERRAPLDDWFYGLPFPGLVEAGLDRAALGLGVLLFLATAANVIVRQTLAATGPQILAEEGTVKGGRILGPLERWLVFALAVSGHLGALAAFVAAKGILRFPEISRDEPDGLRAEYVLVGSFVSWALALVFVPLFGS